MKFLVTTRLLISTCLLLFSLSAGAQYQGEYRFEGVERVVAIGDLHGDYEQYLATLELAGLVNKRGRWIGGKTHLVQTGDVPDRGPDTRKIIDHLARLKVQASKKGGMVHTLVGNHEAMNVSDDLRYVHPGEYEAFKNSGSRKLQNRYYEAHVEAIRSSLAEEEWPAFDEAYRDLFFQNYPLGYVEHRRAWAAVGEYGNWALNNPVAIVVNDSLFLHGGISCKHNSDSLEDLSNGVYEELTADELPLDGMVEGEDGPLWYRGLARTAESEERENVAAILENFRVSRIVLGHTPNPGLVYPRFSGKVVIIDTGIASHYGGHSGYLELDPEGAWAGYRTKKIKLPAAGDQARDVYLDQVSALYTDDPPVQRRIMQMKSTFVPEPEELPSQ